MEALSGQDLGMAVWVRGAAGDGPLLVLLHGLGATGQVWDGVAARWPGGWVIPDLPGHGRSDRLPRYSFVSVAAELAAGLDPWLVAEPAAELVAKPAAGLAAWVAAEPAAEPVATLLAAPVAGLPPAVAAGRPVVVLGHSLGGVLGLTLASGWFGVQIPALCGLGIKLRWSAEELARAAELAGRPRRAFATRAEAVERALKVAGLWRLVPDDSPVAEAAVVESTDGWRLALDNAAFGVGAPDMAGLLAACRAQVILAAGERDPMCPPEQLRAQQPDAVVLPGLGHNAHVEDPDALLPLLDRLRAAAT